MTKENIKILMMILNRTMIKHPTLFKISDIKKTFSNPMQMRKRRSRASLHNKHLVNLEMVF